MDNYYKRISLNGKWGFRMDPKMCGEDEGWLNRPELFTKNAVVPAVIQEQDIGMHERTDGKNALNYHESFEELDPEFLTSKSECYSGAWYVREVALPACPPDKLAWLCFDTVNPFADIFFDGIKVHKHRDGPFFAVRIDVSRYMCSEGVHQIGVHIIDDGFDLQGVVKWPYFSGLYRDVYMEIRDRTRISDAHIETVIETGEARIITEFDDNTPPESIFAEIYCANGELAAHGEAQYVIGQNTEVVLCVPEHRLWSPDDPYLYTAKVCALRGGAVVDTSEFRFGFRRIERDGKRFLLNGRPVMLRGTGFGGIVAMPAPGYASAPWFRRLVERIKEYGFNYLRVHSSALEPELIEAADELGLLLQSELFSVYFETERERNMTLRACEIMLRRNRNHPCITSYVMANEMQSTHPDYIALRDGMCRKARKMAPGTLVFDSDGAVFSEGIPHDESDADTSSVGCALGSVLDLSPIIRKMVCNSQLPSILHEYNYAESFPDVRTAERFTGMIRPFWMEHTLKASKASGCERLLDLYVANSQKIHYNIVKRAIEDARKVEGLAGYGHWGFVDFAHESTGLVNCFLEDKGGTAEDFRQANGEIALSMTVDEYGYTGYQNNEYGFRLHVSNTSGRELHDADLCYCLKIGDETVYSDRRRAKIKEFGVTDFTNLSVIPPVRQSAYAAELVAWIEGENVRNHWKLWFFPHLEKKPLPLKVYYVKEYFPTTARFGDFRSEIQPVYERALWELPADALVISVVMTDAAADYMKRGGRVLLLPAYYKHGDCGLPLQPASFTTVPSFAGVAGSCGSVITKHPLLDGFPHEGWGDYQFFEMMGGERVPHICSPFHHGAPAVFDLEAWPVKVEPIIRSIPNWKKCINRAYMFEVNVGKGKLLACNLRVFENMFIAPECEWMMDSLLRYGTGEAFAPAASVSAEQFDTVRKPATIWRP